MTLLDPNNDINSMKSKRMKKSNVGARIQPAQTSKLDSPVNAKKKPRTRGRGEQQRHNTQKTVSSRSNKNKSPNRHPKTKKSAGGPTSIVPHDMPMGKKDLYFALDCEMVGIGSHGIDSALARVSVVNYDCEIILDTFVKVPVPVTDYRTFVSGVRAEDIESEAAMTLDNVRGAVLDILRGKILIGHGLENDLTALMITHPWCDTRDTATYGPFMREVDDKQGNPDTVNAATKLMLPRRLKDLSMEKLGKKIQAVGHSHSPIEDSLAALGLYKAVRPEWEKSICAEVKKANDMGNSRLVNSLCLPAVQPPPSMYAAQPQHSPSPPSPRQRQRKQRNQHQHYINTPYAPHTVADGRPLYFVPAHDAFQTASAFHQQQSYYHPSMSRNQTHRYQQAPAPAHLRSSVPMIHV